MMIKAAPTEMALIMLSPNARGPMCLCGCVVNSFSLLQLAICLLANITFVKAYVNAYKYLRFNNRLG